jgi:uncharacterized protein (TIGR02270 family)
MMRRIGLVPVMAKGEKPFGRSTMDVVITKDPLWNDVEKHLAEAQVLWPRWEAGLAAADETLISLAKSTEKPLTEHLDALRLGGLKAVVELLLPALPAEDLGRLSATAFVMSAIPTGREPLLSAFLTASGSRLAAFRRGIELARVPDFLATLESRSGAAPLPVRAAVLDIKRFCRDDPGPHTLALLLSDDLPAQVAAARAVRYHRSEVVADRAIDVGMMAPQTEVRNAAIESGLVTGQAEAWSACLQTIRAGAPGSGPLLLLVGLLGAVAEHPLIIEALGGEDDTRRDALWALGFAGSRAAADACVDLLAQDLHPRLAAEALGAITGLDLGAEKLVAPDEQDAPSDQRLPMPDIPGVIRWWNENRPRFSPNERYLGGRPRTAEAIQDALELGSTRRRPPLALEMAIRTVRHYMVATDAFTAQQRREMAAFAALRPADLRRHPQARQFSPL